MINVITDHEISGLVRTLKDAKDLARWGDDESLFNECQRCIDLLRTMKQANLEKDIK